MNGGWSYSWQGEKVEEFAQEYNTFLEAIKNKIGQKNVKFVEAISYNNNGKYFEEENIDIKSAVSAAKSVDYILLFLGENSYCEKPGDLKDLYISENQTELAQAMAKTGKPLILILNEGRPRLIRKFEREMDAIIQTYLPSNYGGDALAEVLFGDENPSGKLPYTYPNFPNSLITYDYKPAEKQEKQEGIYDYASDVKVQYEFGHGLSYTTFEYSELKINTDQLTPYGKVDISVKVKNTGSRTGKEVVMVYTSDLFATISPDNKRLRRFKKIELEPGEIKEVKFEISPRDLAFYNYDNQLVSEKGEFVLSVKDMMLEFNLTETVKFDEPSMVRL
jgi:beta-glucosidase